MATVRLRRTIDADLDFVLKAEQDPANRPFIIPWPRHMHLAALGNPNIAHRIAEDEKQAAVGFIILAGLQAPNASIEFRRVVVVRKRHGYGRAIVQAVKRFAFDELHAHRLWLDVKEDNDRARALYKSEGFAEEGILRECMGGPGGSESLVIMSLLRYEPPT